MPCGVIKNSVRTWFSSTQASSISEFSPLLALGKINSVPPLNQLNIYSNLQLVISLLTRFPLLFSRMCEELQASEALKLNQEGK